MALTEWRDVTASHLEEAYMDKPTRIMLHTSPEPAWPYARLDDRRRAAVDVALAEPARGSVTPAMEEMSLYD